MLFSFHKAMPGFAPARALWAARWEQCCCGELCHVCHPRAITERGKHWEGALIPAGTETINWNYPGHWTALSIWLLPWFWGIGFCRSPELQWMCRWRWAVLSCHHLLPPPHLVIINQTSPGSCKMTDGQQAAREGVNPDFVRHPVSCYKQHGQHSLIFFRAFIRLNEALLQKTWNPQVWRGVGFQLQVFPLQPVLLLFFYKFCFESWVVFWALPRQLHGTEEGKQVLPVQSTCTRVLGMWAEWRAECWVRAKNLVYV